MEVDRGSFYADRVAICTEADTASNMALIYGVVGGAPWSADISADNVAACAGVTGSDLDTATACEAVMKVSDSTVRACTYAGPNKFFKSYDPGQVTNPQSSVCLDNKCR